MNNLSDMVLKLKEYKALTTAAKLLDELLTRSSHALQYLDVGNCFLIINNQEKAAECFENALSVAESTDMMYDLRMRLANVYIDTKQHSKAKIYLETNKKIKMTAELQYLLNKVNEEV